MNRLKEGTKLQKIVWPDDAYYKVGEGIKSIAVNMEAGQMAEVPWAVVLLDEGAEELINLAHVATVRLVKE